LGISLTKDTQSFKQDIRQLERYILSEALEWARKILKSILEQLDELFKEKRDKKLKIIDKRGTWYKTYLGSIKVKRRYYRDQYGAYHYLLDELLDMDKYRHTTVDVQQLALELASAMTFRKSAEVLEKITPINLSHQTIKNMLTRVADRNLEQKEVEIRHFLETGEMTEGEGKKTDILLMEADGVMLSLQRAKEKKAEVKLGIAYEGWDKVGNDRYRTTNKTFYADIASSERFWAGFSLKLQSKYDLAGINQVVLGGDGASWVKDGLGYFGGQFQLSRYHYNKELRRVLSNDKESISLIREACENGDIATVVDKLETLRKTAKGKWALELKRLEHYLVANASGLKGYRCETKIGRDIIRRTGAMEGNVDKLIARRMKNQGMSWSPKGIRSMLVIRFKVLEKTLEKSLHRNIPKTHIPPLGKKSVTRIIDKVIKGNYFEYFNVGLPALSGPHASRPWVKILKSLAEV
jgi:hypothetical protein